MRVLGEALFNTFSERMFRLQFADIGQNGAASPICDAKQRVHVGIRGQHFYDIQVARLHRVPEGSGIVDHKVRVSGVRLPKKLNVAQSNGLFSLLRIRPEVILRVQELLCVLVHLYVTVSEVLVDRMLHNPSKEVPSGEIPHNIQRGDGRRVGGVSDIV